MQREMQDLITQASRGDLESQFKLGWSYRYGKGGFTQNIDVAYEWLGAAAKRNHHKAQRHFAFFFLDDGSGRTIKHDPKQAVIWLELAGDNGDSGALHDLINVLTFEFPEERRSTFGSKIIECYTKLANIHNDPIAKVELGAIYCGSPYNRYRRNFSEIASSVVNAKIGFPMIEDGVRVAKNADKIPFEHKQYEEMFYAYNFDTVKMLESKEYYHQGAWIVTAFEKSFEYSRMVVETVKNEIPMYGSEYVENTVSHWNKTSDFEEQRLQKILELQKSKVSSRLLVEEIIKLLS